ncbi:response regulator transcription factor, partial [Aphanothece microscopica]|uniref:response regulator transcription factor n=1 Tax=Aphanothece microscopica TaxID=1049561 RepID=UPI003984B96E
MKPRVLAIDDVPEILDLVRQSLSNEGFEVQTSTSMTDYRTRFDQDSFDVYLIDVSLPDGNGFALVQELSQRTTSGIILLTGRASETDQVVGLEIGADDYITKPFRLRELAARVRAVHRRTAEALAARPRSVDAPAPPES